MNVKVQIHSFKSVVAMENNKLVYIVFLKVFSGQVLILLKYRFIPLKAFCCFVTRSKLLLL